MRVKYWTPGKYDAEFENIAYDRLKEAAEVVAQEARSRCKTGTISRPMYKTGPYAGQIWTSRDAGRLKASIRVVEKFSKFGVPLKRDRNIRVYAGSYLAYYAKIVEYNKSFLRTALNKSRSRIKTTLGVK
ncbi:MAG TPA: HK97 gp10 family phage protein [Sunxiuqinia sp.]|nr:HK97 gp10 family phage protein [Sunxiuqinia sp.]